MKAEPFVHARIRPGGLHDNESHVCSTCKHVGTCERYRRINKGQHTLWYREVRLSAILECSDYEEELP